MTASLDEAFIALSPHCEISAALCYAAAKSLLSAPMDVGKICTQIRLPQSSASEVEKVLEVARGLALFERSSPLIWRCTDEALTRKLAPMLRGALLYQQRVHHDKDLVDVVLTKPPDPSHLVQQLERTLQGSAGFRDTKELLPAIAELAKQSFTVMTPFLDSTGAEIVINLFERTSAPDKWLIVRPSKDGLPQPGLVQAAGALRELGVKVLTFHIGRAEGGGNETFHAKVVLADDMAAYVGSSNMTEWSFNYSLEIGVFVRGIAAKRIAHLIGAVRRVSRL